MKASSLIKRDPAAAALLGLNRAGGGGFDAEFGADPDLGDDFGDEFGDEFGDDFGAEPTKAGLQRAWHYYQKAQKRARYGRGRERLLEPNKGSAEKVEQYVFSMSKTLTVGSTDTFTIDDRPDTSFRPQRVTTNIVNPLVVTIADIKVANVSVNVGGGTIDAYQFNANSVGQRLDLPTLSPANRARVIGAYNGAAPVTGLTGDWDFSVTFVGPAQMVGG